MAQLGAEFTSESLAQDRPPHLPASTIKYLFCPFTSHHTLSKDAWLHMPAPAGPSGAGTMNENVSCSTTILPSFLTVVADCSLRQGFSTFSLNQKKRSSGLLATFNSP